MTTTEHGFKAEVQQILQLMIRSVYSDREVFLRELLSNAADALDKLRFVELTETGLVDGFETAGVKIEVNGDLKEITIEDDGIGMTEEEAIDHLGTIARSGSKAFVERLKDQAADAPKLIGQFGVGFYSAFMVAEEVVVETRSARGGSATLWRSKGEGTFQVEPSSRTLRGTSITLKLREDAYEFAEVEKLREIVEKHSNFLSWPIFLDGRQANAAKALWMQREADVSDEEANAFYKQVGADWRDPALRLHVAVDSPIQMNALLFVPSERPYDLFHPEAPRGPRLYARKVLIEDHCKELLPDWLRFVRGVVDSEDVPLNVSREMVQKTPAVRKIKLALTKRVLKAMQDYADAGPAEEGQKDKKAIYAGIWKNFGVCIKEGYYHDRFQSGEQILPLLRFNALSHADEDGLMSLAEAKAAMKEGQESIWFLAASSREAALASPHLEAARKRGWEVLLLTDTVDEWLMTVLTEFEGTPIKSLARGEFKETEEEKAAEKADLSGLGPYIHGILGGRVHGVRESQRLVDSACVLVDEDNGMSANLERILRAANQDVQASSKRVLELNLKHPLIKNLAKLHDLGRKDITEPMIELLYDDALLLEGTVKEPAAVGRRLQHLLQTASAAALGN